MPHSLNASDRALVEQAKGVLMLRYGVGSRESLAVLDRWAGDASVSLREVADALVTGICQGRVTPESDGTVRWLEQRLRGDIDGLHDAGEEVAPVPDVRAAAAPRPAPRQWRYASAVHAARVLRSR